MASHVRSMGFLLLVALGLFGAAGGSTIGAATPALEAS